MIAETYCRSVTVLLAKQSQPGVRVRRWTWGGCTVHRSRLGRTRRRCWGERWRAEVRDDSPSKWRRRSTDWAELVGRLQQNIRNSYMYLLCVQLSLCWQDGRWFSNREKELGRWFARSKWEWVWGSRFDALRTQSWRLATARNRHLLPRCTRNCRSTSRLPVGPAHNRVIWFH